MQAIFAIHLVQGHGDSWDSGHSVTCHVARESVDLSLSKDMGTLYDAGDPPKSRSGRDGQPLL
jgi:hypothetical protein